jgi:cytochrome c2
MYYNPLIYKQILIIFFSIFSLAVFAQPDLAVGKTLFRNQCASCHNKNMKVDLTGPALGGVEDRWAEYPREDLFKWIRNSQALINEGHPRGVELWNQWKPTNMQAFPNLTDEEIESLLFYINDEFTKVPVAAVQGPGGAAQASDTNKYLYYILFIILGIVAIVLSRIVANLNRIVAVQEGEPVGSTRNVMQVLVE